MRDYDERFEQFDDSRCYHCGVKFPADMEIDEGTPQWEGFCCEQCRTDHDNKVPRPQVARPLADLLDAELGREGLAGWEKSIYKGTACGAWIKVWGETVTVGSIVEGADCDAESVMLEWPFTKEEFWDAVQQVEDSADEIWHEWNEEE